MMILPTNSRRGCLRVLLVLLLSRLTTAQFPSPAPATFPPVSLDTQTPTVSPIVVLPFETDNPTTVVLLLTDAPSQATATAAPVVVVTTAAPVVAATAAPTDIPTVAPVVVATLEPTLAPIVVTAAPVVAATSVPTAAPVTAAPVTEAPVVTTQAPAVAATSVPTVAPVAATTQVPTVTSTTTAPVITTEAPSTAAPTPVGTETLAPSTAAPVVAVDTNAPTAGSAAPSIGIVPTDAPSVVPTKAPVVLTTSVPSIAPVETFVPTAVGTTGMPATMEPTAQDDTGTGMPSLSPEQDFLQQSETFDEIEMILEGVTEMDATSVGIFEAVTKEWFQEFYNGDNRRRKLAFGDGLASVRIMTTTITFLGQDPVAADPDANQPLPVNTVRYKQEVNYFANAQAPTADQLVLIPFEDSDGNARYVSDLRSFGDATFENVQSPIEVPVIDEIDSGSDGLSGGAIAGIAVGGAVALLAAGYVGFRAMGGSDRSASGYVDPDTRPPASFNVSASEDVSTMEDPNQKVASGDGSLAEYGDQRYVTDVVASGV